MIVYAWLICLSNLVLLNSVRALQSLHYSLINLLQPSLPFVIGVPILKLVRREKSYGVSSQISDTSILISGY